MTPDQGAEQTANRMGNISCGRMVAFFAFFMAIALLGMVVGLALLAFTAKAATSGNIVGFVGGSVVILLVLADVIRRGVRNRRQGI